MPIILALADRAGLGEGSAGRNALALAIGFGIYQLSASILPANVPNLIMTGAAERAYGVQFDYMSYLVLHAPVLGILKGGVLIACLAWLFPASPHQIEARAERTPLSAAEWRLAIVLLATLAFWMTDSLHGVRPAWVGLVSACLCLLPRVGFLNGEEFAAGVNVRTRIYLGGILGLAAVVAWVRPRQVHRRPHYSASAARPGAAGARFRLDDRAREPFEFRRHRQRRCSRRSPPRSPRTPAFPSDRADVAGLRLSDAAVAVSGGADRGRRRHGESAGLGGGQDVPHRRPDLVRRARAA
jgi:hypothetical protein